MRFGQAVYNIARDLYPDEILSIEPKNDCYYRDERISYFLDNLDKIIYENMNSYNANIEMCSLKQRWRDVCNLYLKSFCDKHEYCYEPDMWVSDDPGTIICVSDMFVNMDDIRYDVDNNIPKEMFSKWYWKSLEVYELTGENFMNYKSFCKGAPDPWTEDKLKVVRDGKKKIQAMTDDLNNYINDCKKDNLF